MHSKTKCFKNFYNLFFSSISLPWRDKKDCMIGKSKLKKIQLSLSWCQKLPKYGKATEILTTSLFCKTSLISLLVWLGQAFWWLAILLSSRYFISKMQIHGMVIDQWHDEKLCFLAKNINLFPISMMSYKRKFLLHSVVHILLISYVGNF